MLQKIRKTLLAGLLVLMPISLSVYILFHLFVFFDGLLRDTIVRFAAEKIFHTQLDFRIPGLGILAILALLLITGALTRNYLGRKFISISDRIITRIPLINRVYSALRDISEAVFAEKREIFKKAVLFEYPRKGMFSIGFYTQDTTGPVQEAIREDVVSVFLPTTPNPTSGYLLFVPKSSIVDLDISVEEALKLVISGGSIHIKKKPRSRTAAETGQNTAAAAQPR